MSPHRRPALIDLEIGQPWYVRSEVVRTEHRRFWGTSALGTFLLGNFYYDDIIDMLLEKRILRNEEHNNCLSCALVVVGFCLFFIPYFLFFIVVAYARLPGPYKLRRSEKKSFDCALVAVCSCWTVYMRHQTNTTILGLVYCFHVIPMLNLWWDYDNFSLWDCLLTALIEGALFYCRNHIVLVMGVAGVGVALQLKKNAYQERCIKSSMDK